MKTDKMDIYLIKLILGGILAAIVIYFCLVFLLSL